MTDVVTTEIVAMTAHGVEGECPGCGKSHRRGDLMTAIPYRDGEPAGWFCPECVARWRAGQPMAAEAAKEHT